MLLDYESDGRFEKRAYNQEIEFAKANGVPEAYIERLEKLAQLEKEGSYKGEGF